MKTMFTKKLFVILLILFFVTLKVILEQKEFQKHNNKLILKIFDSRFCNFELPLVFMKSQISMKL